MNKIEVEKSIPYSRFKEVNDKFKDVSSELEAYRKKEKEENDKKRREKIQSEKELLKQDKKSDLKDRIEMNNCQTKEYADEMKRLENIIRSTYKLIS